MNEVNKQDLRQRRILITGVIVIFFFFLFYGFFKIQVYSADKYAQISFENSVRQITLHPNRGVIRDSYGRIMVDNRPSFLVSIIPRQFPKSKIPEFASIIGKKIDKIKICIINKIVIFLYFIFFNKFSPDFRFIKFFFKLFLNMYYNNIIY